MLDVWILPLLEVGLDSLWQAPVVAAAAWLIVRRFDSPGIRCAVWRAALFAAAATPWTSDFRWDAPAAGQPPTVAVVPVAAPPVIPAPQSGLAAPAEVWFALFGLWAAAALWSTGRLAGGLRRAAAIKRAGAPLDREGPDQWRVSAGCRRRFRTLFGAQSSPLAVGWLRPAVLLPRTGLGTADARRLWLHEAAHLERFDDWLQIAERLIAAAFCFNPTVGWILRRAEAEREAACDRFAADRGDGARAYALALARVLENRLQPGAALAAAGERSSIERRIRMLLETPNPSRRPGAVVCAAVAVCALLVCAFPSPIALAQSVAPPTPIPPVSPAQSAAPAAAPAPKPPPAPEPSPAPAPKPVPAPQPAPAAQPREAREQAEQMRQLQEELRPDMEELHRLGVEIQQLVEEQMRGKQDQMRALAERIHVEVERSIQPAHEEIQRLTAQLAENPDLHAQIEERIQAASERIGKAEIVIRDLEVPMQEIEIDLEPIQEQVRRLELKMREHERAIDEKVDRLEQLQDRQPE